MKEYYRQRYLENRDEILAKQRERYKDPAVRAKKREYDKKRQEKLKAAGISTFTQNKRAAHYKNRYNITIEDYNRMMAEQEGRCKICSKEHVSSKKMAVDHCHVTGRVRGLLCEACNKGLGHFSDNPDLLTKALDYLKNS